MADRKLTLYTHPMSRGHVARWMLEETSLPYEAVILDYGTTMKAPEYLAINPMGKVPALRDGDTVITENAAICLHLADLVPELGLAPPPGSAQRGSYYRWFLFLAGPLESMLTAKQAGKLAPPLSAGYGRENDVLDVLEAALKDRAHLVGERFTALDLYAAACLGFYLASARSRRGRPSRPSCSATRAGRRWRARWRSTARCSTSTRRLRRLDARPPGPALAA